MEEVMIEFLEIGPMTEALKKRPADFERDGNWLHHFPSNHRFQVDRDGNVRIDAPCDCAILHARREQGKEFWSALQIWEAAYWCPVEINREFARHFREPNFGQRLHRGLRVSFRRFLQHHSFVAEQK
jgi:hypothetical protein